MTDDITLWHGAIAVDLDGTLAQYDKWRGPGHIGEPVPAMARRVDRWLHDGVPVVILTTRVWSNGEEWRNLEAQTAYAAIKLWLIKHFGKELPVTCMKNPGMIEIWDDRAVAVEKNTGRVLNG